MTQLRIALAQVNPAVGDMEANVAALKTAAARARRGGADLVCFPELSVCGYPPEDLLLRPQFLARCEEAVQDLRRRNGSLVTVVGWPRRGENDLYNSAAVLEGDRVAAAYDKRELPNYGVFDERRYFSPGSSPVVVSLRGVRIALTICEDLWADDSPVRRDLEQTNPDLVLNLSASPFHAGKMSRREEVLGRAADAAGCPVAWTNLVGGQDELVFDGGSTVVRPGGGVMARANRFVEDLLFVDIEADEDRGGADEDADVVLQSPGPAPEEKEVPTVAPTMGEAEEIYDALALGLDDYMRKNDFERAVLGLSGGIDSSLSAAIAADALGETNVVGVTMPSRYSSEGTKTDAERVAHNLGIKLITLPVERVLKACWEELESEFEGGRPGVEYENLQARIRGNFLMALSNRFGWLVLATGNKSELSVGYCTLYGDMTGGFAVIKDVTKTMVYRLARYFNERAGQQVIPDSVLTRAPSAELAPDQEDQDVLPPYEELDPILQAYVEQDLSPSEISAQGHDWDTVQRVVRMVDRSEYKRRQAPPGVKITPRAFGKDRRLPITNCFNPEKME